MKATAFERLQALLELHGLGEAASRVRIDVEGGAPGCRLPVGEDAAAALAAAAVAADQVWQRRGGTEQDVLVSTRHAGASLRGYANVWLDGSFVGGSPADDNPLVDFYRTADGRWFFVHGVLEHLAEGTMRVLGIQDRSRGAVAEAVARWNADALEDALARARMCGAYARSYAEWCAHPHGRLLAALPCVEVERIGDAPPEPLSPAARPLSDVRVLDLTRIIAGPTASRTLAEHGADVLHVGSSRLPNMPVFELDTGHGKRSADIDIDTAAGRASITALARETDVWVQGYRTGSLERRQLGPGDLAAQRPGIVCVSVNCYGHQGPWADRPGWDQLAATATGMAMRQGTPERPQLMPAAACDYVTGYLAAYGAMVALARRTREGGSWHVKASLAQTAMWFQQQDDIVPMNDDALASAMFLDTQSALGRIRHLAPVARMSHTPPRWSLPPAPLGSHPAQWLPR